MAYLLFKDIEVILQAELNKFREIGRRSGGLGSMICFYGGREHSGPYPEWRIEGDVHSRTIILDAPHGAVHSENLDTLMLLYSSLDDSGKRSFREILLWYLRKDSPFKDIAYFIVWGLYRVGVLDIAITSALNLLGAGSYVFDDIRRLIDVLTRFEGRFFIEKELEAVERFAKRATLGTDEQLLKRLTDVRIEILRNRLSDVNPEINADRDKVVQLWTDEFKDKIIENLTIQVEDMFKQGPMDATQFAACMDRIRALIIEVCKRVGQKIEELSSKKYSGDWNNEHSVFAYLARKDIEFLTEREKGLVIDIYGLSSELGAHRIIAEREYARLTKNIAYELFLLILEKLKKFTETTRSTKRT